MPSDQSKPIIVTIRYSVLQEHPEGWLLRTKNAFEDYKAKLFDADRLRGRLHFLKHAVMPSFFAQTDPDNIHVAVITSTELPGWHLDDLNEYVSTDPRMRVVLNAPDIGINHREPLEDILLENGYTLYAHVRNDDDDALSLDYAARLRRYISDDHIGFGVSFGLGYGGLFDEKTKSYSEFRHLYYPRVSCGMAVINKFDPASRKYASSFRTAYEMGSHTRVDQRTPLILDSVTPAFVYSIYPGQDTSNDMLRHTKETVDPDKVLQLFALSPQISPKTNAVAEGA